MVGDDHVVAANVGLEECQMRGVRLVDPGHEAVDEAKIVEGPAV